MQFHRYPRRKAILFAYSMCVVYSDTYYMKVPQIGRVYKKKISLIWQEPAQLNL